MSVRAEQEAKDDKELVRRSREGDTEAFEMLVRRYQKRVFGIAVGIVRNPEEAADITQDAFVRVFRHLSNFKGNSSFYTWLYRITVNLSIDSANRQGRHRTIDFDESRRSDNEDTAVMWQTHDLRDHPLDRMEIKELGEVVSKAMDKLSEKHRTVLLLREVESMTYEEIAEVMRCSMGTVMSRLFHARNNMKKLVSDYLKEKD